MGFLCASVKCVQFQLWGNRVFPLITQQIGFHWRSILSDESAALTAKEGPHKYHCFLYFSPHSLLRFQPFLCHIHSFWPPDPFFPVSLCLASRFIRDGDYSRGLSVWQFLIQPGGFRWMLRQMHCLTMAMACMTEDGSTGGKFKEKANFSSNFFQKKKSTSLHRFNLMRTNMLTSWHLSSRPSALQSSVCNSACFLQLFKIPCDLCTKEFLNRFSALAESYINFTFQDV